MLNFIFWKSTNYGKTVIKKFLDISYKYFGGFYFFFFRFELLLTVIEHFNEVLNGF